MAPGPRSTGFPSEAERRLWRHAKLIVEIDGFAAHGTRAAFNATVRGTRS